jgi:hypothetical protein
MRAILHIGSLVCHVNAAAHGGVDGGVLASDKSVPGIVAHVIGTSGLIDAQQVERAALMADFDTHIVASNAHRPVGNAVGVDLASKNTDRARVLNMRSSRNGASLLEKLLSGKSSCSDSENAQNGGERELHFGFEALREGMI